MGAKAKGIAWAYVASDWRKFTSFTKETIKLVDMLAEKGYVTHEYNKGEKPARRPNRREVLAARGVTTEETENHGE